MPIRRETNLILGSDRYAFDYRAYTYAKGWAQVDSPADASYYGNWINPGELKLASYCEGDFSVTSCDTVKEFVGEVYCMIAFLKKMGGRGQVGIDPGTAGGAIDQQLRSQGLDRYYHPPRSITA